MKDLEKMKESCIEFSKDLKTGDVTWKSEPNDYFSFAFIVTTNLGKIKLFLGDRFFYSFVEKSVFLKSTTAKEAAHEALQLVKNEAQKLVDMLSEPKDFWTKIDRTNLPKHQVICINALGAITFGTLTLICSSPRNNECFYCKTGTGNSILKNPTHYHDISQYPKP